MKQILKPISMTNFSLQDKLYNFFFLHLTTLNDCAFLFVPFLFSFLKRGQTLVITFNGTKYNTFEKISSIVFALLRINVYMYIISPHII